MTEQIPDAKQAVHTALDSLGNIALKVMDQRDEALYVIDTLITNMAQQIKTLPVTEGNYEAGVYATAIANWLDYARDQRSRLP